MLLLGLSTRGDIAVKDNSFFSIIMLDTIAKSISLTTLLFYSCYVIIMLEKKCHTVKSVQLPKHYIILVQKLSYDSGCLLSTYDEDQTILAL